MIQSQVLLVKSRDFLHDYPIFLGNPIKWVPFSTKNNTTGGRCATGTEVTTVMMRNLPNKYTQQMLSDARAGEIQDIQGLVNVPFWGF